MSRASSLISTHGRRTGRIFEDLITLIAVLDDFELYSKHSDSNASSERSDEPVFKWSCNFSSDKLSLIYLREYNIQEICKLLTGAIHPFTKHRTYLTTSDRRHSVAAAVSFDTFVSINSLRFISFYSNQWQTWSAFSGDSSRRKRLPSGYRRVVFPSSEYPSCPSSHHLCRELPANI